MAIRVSFKPLRKTLVPRCLMTLLLGYPLPELPYLKIPLHTVIKLTLVDTELIVEYNRLPVDCVDTYRYLIFQFGIAF
jgi:hypothetical protein